jgi:cold shock CspA family protein
MPQGTVKSKGLNLERGFGFITTGHRSDIFFHANDCLPELSFDSTLQERFVEYDIEETPRGPKAVRVRPAYGVCR